MKKIFFRTVAFFLFVLLPFAGICNPDGGGGGDPTGGGGTIDTPIDSWLLLLLFAGMLYGWYKHRQRQKPAVK